VNNCIGKRNHRRFVFFLIFVICALITNVIACVYRLVDNPSIMGVICSAASLLASLTAMSGAGGILLRNLSEIARGVTGNEDIRNKWKGRNPYDMGCLKNYKNFLCKPIGPSILEIRRYCNSENSLIV